MRCFQSLRAAVAVAWTILSEAILAGEAGAAARPLTRVEAVKALGAEAEARALPVVLEGVVTGSREYLLVVQDATEAFTWTRPA